MERDGVVERTMHFAPEKVIAWLLKHELVTMRRDGRTLVFETPNGRIDRRA